MKPTARNMNYSRDDQERIIPTTIYSESTRLVLPFSQGEIQLPIRWKLRHCLLISSLQSNVTVFRLHLKSCNLWNLKLTSLYCHFQCLPHEASTCHLEKVIDGRYACADRLRLWFVVWETIDSEGEKNIDNICATDSQTECPCEQKCQLRITLV